MQQGRENRFMYMLKGIACLLVMTVHFPLPGMTGKVVRVFARCAVPIFFIISGRYMYGKGSPETIGMRTRLLRRFVCFACITLGVLAVYTLYSFVSYRNEGMGIHDWIQMKYQPQEWWRLLTLNSGKSIWDSSYTFDFLWYMFAMLWVLLFMSIALHWSTDVKLAVCVALMCMLYVCQYMGYSRTLPLINLSCKDYKISRNWLFTGIPFTLVGVLIAEKESHKTSKTLIWWVVAAFGIYFAWREVNYFVGRELSLGVGMLSVALVMLAEQYPNFGSRTLAFVGKHLAANVYYWHVLIGAILRRILKDPHETFPYLVMIYTLLLALALHVLKRIIVSCKNRTVTS